MHTQGIGPWIHVARGTRVLGYTWERSCSSRGYAAGDRCPEKREGRVSALHSPLISMRTDAEVKDNPLGVILKVF